MEKKKDAWVWRILYFMPITVRKLVTADGLQNLVEKDYSNPLVGSFYVYDVFLDVEGIKLKKRLN